MSVLSVYAHPEPRSFKSAFVLLARRLCHRLLHTVFPQTEHYRLRPDIEPATPGQHRGRRLHVPEDDISDGD